VPVANRVKKRIGYFMTLLLTTYRAYGTGFALQKRKARTRAQQRAAGTNKAALFDIVNAARGNGSLCVPRVRTPVRARPALSCPGRAPRVRALRGPRVNSAETQDPEA